jgi:predicted lipoprotein with Yx(FWY)xxD motif
MRRRAGHETSEETQMKGSSRFVVGVSIVATALLIAAAGLALAEAEPGPVTISVTEHEQFGEILVAADGRSVYLFVNEEAQANDDERMTEGLRTNVAPCVGGCLDAWPPVVATDIVAGEGVDEELLYLEEVDGRMQAVYNGWPLYYFARDAAAGDVNGQGLGSGNVWYLVNPAGWAVGTAEEEAAAY